MTLSLGERWRSCMNNAVGHCSEGTGGQRAQGANGSTGSVQAKYITAIPDAVEEAAAKALAAVRMPNYTWNDLDRGMQKYLRSDARAAIAQFEATAATQETRND